MSAESHFGIAVQIWRNRRFYLRFEGKVLACGHGFPRAVNTCSLCEGNGNSTSLRSPRELPGFPDDKIIHQVVIGQDQKHYNKGQ